MRSAMEWLEEFDGFDDLVLFLDFDGTLAPIVERPGDARPLEGVVDLVEKISKYIPVGVISGRGLDDVRKRFGADGIYYAGSHGMEILTPHGERHEPEKVQELSEEIDRQRARLHEIFDDVDGVELEEKRFGMAVHFRRNPEARQQVERALNAAVEDHPRLKVGEGKMVRELQPDLDWHKGTALRFIWQKIPRGESCFALYLGDDVTDEDAFEEIGDDGMGILVAEEKRPTAAGLGLDNPQQVRDFLMALLARIEGADQA